MPEPPVLLVVRPDLTMVPVIAAVVTMAIRAQAVKAAT